MSDPTIPAVERALEEGWARAAEALKSSDAAAMAALFADDATLIDLGMPTVFGRARLEEAYRAAFASVTFLGMTHEQEQLTVSGGFAVENGVFTQTMRGPDGNPVSSTNRYLMVWKQVEDRWLVLRDASIPFPPDAAQG